MTGRRHDKKKLTGNSDDESGNKRRSRLNDDNGRQTKEKIADNVVAVVVDSGLKQSEC